MELGALTTKSHLLVDVPSAEMAERSMMTRNPIKYELTDEELLNLYYSEPRLAALMELDVFRLIDGHLVVNLREFITPKTQHLTAYAKRNLPACCIGILTLKIIARNMCVSS